MICKSFDFISLNRLMSSSKLKSSISSESVSSSNLLATVLAKLKKSCSFFRRIWAAVYCLFCALMPAWAANYLQTGRRWVVPRSIVREVRLCAFPHLSMVLLFRLVCWGQPSPASLAFPAFLRVLSRIAVLRVWLPMVFAREVWLRRQKHQLSWAQRDPCRRSPSNRRPCLVMVINSIYQL